MILDLITLTINAATSVILIKIIIKLKKDENNF